MRLDIKNISIKSIVLSVYPIVIFIFSLVRAGVSAEIGLELSLFQILMSVLLVALVETAALVILSLVFAFFYNLFCAFGMRGLRITLEDVEEPAAQESENDGAR
ncbi:MAG: hypothetical protein LBR90_01205 [Elusimicrobiota bacterium]|jgi:hypothetical protein|nr:hypothetical protein [Elusimicrobiota bacterium]